MIERLVDEEPPDPEHYFNTVNGTEKILSQYISPTAALEPSDTRPHSGEKTAQFLHHRRQKSGSPKSRKRNITISIAL